MNIENYQYRVFYSDEDRAYVSSIAEFPYLSADGATPEEAIAELKGVVAETVDILVSEGREPPIPLSQREYKGNISLRLSPEIHRLIIIRAREEGCSLNQFLTSLIERNLYADKIDVMVKKLGRVVVDMEVNQAVRDQLSPAPQLYAGSQRLGINAPFIQAGSAATVLNTPFTNTVFPDQGGI